MPLTTAPCVIQTDLLMTGLAATSKRQAFRAIAERTALMFGGDSDVLLTALLERERIGTTGIGAGVAIPHVKVDGVNRVYGVLACLATPVDYDAIDGAPVDIVFMLLAPADSKTTQHLKVLAQMSRFLRDPQVVAGLRATRDESVIATLIKNWITTQVQQLAC